MISTTPTPSGGLRSSWRSACCCARSFRNEVYGYGVAIAYLEGSGERVETKFELWRELIYDIRGLRLDSYGITERLRSWHQS